MRIFVDQGTRQWHLWRQGGIGGSDAPPIMGCGFVSADELLAEKLGGEQRPDSFAMRRGRKLEPVARKLLCDRTGLHLVPICVQHNEVEWLRASLDGVDFWGETICEIKCPNVVDHEIALGGVVPRHCWPQVQHQLLVTDAEVCLYASYSTAERFGEQDQLAIVEVESDAEYQAKLIEEERKFWEKLSAARMRKTAV